MQNANAKPETTRWQSIETATKDGTVVWTYTAAAHGLPAFQGPCAYHRDSGWCTDELRTVTHWVPLTDVYIAPPPRTDQPNLADASTSTATGSPSVQDG